MGKSKNQTTKLTIVINGKEVKNNLTDIGQEVGKLNRELKGLTRDSEEFYKKAAELQKAKQAYADIKKEIQGTIPFFDRMAKGTGGFLSAIGLGIGIQTFVSGIQNAYQKVKEFASAQSELAAILGKSKVEIAGLTALTLKLGATTAFTATQATQAATELAKLGFTEKEISQSLEGIINGAVALGSEIPETAELVAATLKAFGLQATETNRVVSTLAAGANATSLGFESLKTSLGNVAPAAAAANYSIEQTVALLGLITDNGIDASTAGTSLRNMLIKLSASGMTLDEALNQIASSQDKLTKATELFDVRSAVSAIALASQKDKVSELTDALTGQEAVLKQMAETRLDNLEGSTTLFESAWEGLILSIEKGDGAIGKAVRSVVDLGTSLLGLITPTQNYSDELLQQQVQMNMLAAEYMNLTENDANREATLAKLRSNYPELLGYLSNELVSNKDLANALVLVNQQYQRKISFAKSQEELNKAVEYERKVNERVLKTQGEIRNKLVEISNLHPEIKIDFQADDIIKETERIIQELNSLDDSNGGHTARLDLLIHRYNIFSGTLGKATKETSEAREESLQFQEDIVRQEKQNLSLSISYEKAYETLEKYKNSTISQAEAYQKLTNNQTASKEEFILFEKLMNNFSKETLTEFIDKVARGNLAIDSGRESIKSSNLTYAAGVKIRQDYANLFSESERKTENYKKSIEGLTAAQILEKTQLIQRIQAMDQNISMNDLMISSLDALTGRFNNLSKSIPNTSSIKGVQDWSSQLREKWLNATSPEDRAKYAAEMKEMQKLEDEMTGKADEERRRKAEESSKKAQQASKQAGEKAKAEKKKLQDEAIKEEEKLHKSLLDAERKYQDEAYSLMIDGLVKEQILLSTEFDRRKEDLQKEIDDLYKLQKEYLKKASQASKLGDPVTAEKFKKLAKDQVQIIAEKNATIDTLEDIHAAKRIQLVYEYRQKELQATQRLNQRKLDALQIEHNKDLASITSLETAKALLRNFLSEKELKKIKTIEQAKKEITIKQQKESYDAQLKQLKQLQEELEAELAKNTQSEESGLGSLFTKEQKNALIDRLNEVKLKLSEINLAAAGNSSLTPEEKEERDAGAKSQMLSGIDLLGFSAEQWDQVFTQLETAKTKMEEWAARIQIVSMAVKTLQNAWAMMYEAQQAAAQKSIQLTENESRKKQQTLKKQLDEGYLTQEQYEAKKEKLEADTERRKAQIEYQTAMQKYRMDIANALSNTALGVTSALATSGNIWTGLALATAVGAMGALQLGVIKANKPVRSYAQGGVTSGLGFKDDTGEEVAGVAHADEYYIPRWLRKDPEIAPLERYIEYKRKGGTRSFAEGGETSPKTSNTDVYPTESSFNLLLLNVLKENGELLSYLKENSLIAFLSNDVKTLLNLSKQQEQAKKRMTNNKIFK